MSRLSFGFGIISESYSPIMMSDIESIDKEESNITNEDNKSIKNEEVEFHEIKTEIDMNIKEEIKTEVDDAIDAPIKNEYTEEQRVTDFQKPKLEITIKENLSDEVKSENVVSNEFYKEENQLDEGVGEAINQRKKRSEELPDYKEVTVVNDIRLNKHDSQTSNIQYLACSLSRRHTVFNQPIKKKILLKDKYNRKTLTQKYEYSKIRDSSTNKKINNLFICDICDKYYLNKNTLLRHTENHSKIHSCSECNYKTNTKLHLAVHIITSHTNNISFNCSYCSFKTKQKTYLDADGTAKHTKKKSLICTLCKYKNLMQYNLTSHDITKHTKDIVFNCSYCSFKTCIKKTLNNHINVIHAKNISFDHFLCYYKTYNKLNLQRHINLQHTKFIFFKCSYCDFKTFDKQTLNQHVNIKHTRNPFTSFFCVCTAYKRTLIKHVEFKRTKGSTYNCSFCKYTTYYLSSLFRHTKTKHS